VGRVLGRPGIVSRVRTGLVLASAVVAAASAPVASAATLIGFVRTALRPVAGVHVLVPARDAYAVTDSSGRFALERVPVGLHELRLVAVGYRPTGGRVTVAAADAESPVDAGTWVLEPLQPDGASPGFVAPPAGAVAVTPPPLVPALELYRTPDEASRWPAVPELTTAANGPPPGAPAAAFADLLRRVAVADSITAATGGTGAPGFETWSQWADRFESFAGDSAQALDARLDADSALVVRAAAYTRTRAALAAGRTTAGYRIAALARAALERSRRAGGSDAAWLAGLASALAAVFTPGSSPPRPAPARKTRPRARRRGR
jgi:hypothetical protein